MQFDGANLVTDVWVNGVHLGQHVGGYAIFRFDATQAIHPGEQNVIAVRVDNSRQVAPPISADYTFFGGLYRKVHLITVDSVHLQMLDYGSPGVYLTPSYNAATHVWTVQARTKVQNDASDSRSLQVVINLIDPTANNAIVGTITSNNLSVPNGFEWEAVGSTAITNPHLWNGKANPFLYRAEIEIHDLTHGNVLSDGISQTFGLRTYRVGPDQGFILNGMPYNLHGVNKHQDRQDKGWAISDADSDEDFRLIDEIGATAVRMCHYEHSQHEYDLMDRYGLVAWAEIPLIDRVTNADDPTIFNDNTQQQLVELIRQNYNHPSICFWSISNEITRTMSHTMPDPQPLLTILNAVAHSEDPTRLTTMASVAGSENNPINEITDVIGFNCYFGWYYGGLTGANSIAFWLAGYHNAFPDRAFALTEYGAGSSIERHSDHPYPGDHTEEYQNLYHEWHETYLKNAPYVWGTFIWNMFDFAAGERNEGDTAGRNDKGLVTYDRQTKKDAFYWYKANWTTKPFVYITGHTYTHRTTATADVKVYANVPYVTIRVNGAPQPMLMSTNHLFIWKQVPLLVGTNVIQATGSGDTPQDAPTDTVTWTMTPNLFLTAGGRRPFTDAQERYWDVDTTAMGGTVSSTKSVIAGTTEQALYQTSRLGAFSEILWLQPGNYNLDLMFDEPFWKARGKRVFSVTANKTPLLTNYDIFAEVGKNRAVHKIFHVTVLPGGNLTLDFTPKTDKAIVCAISATQVNPAASMPFGGTPAQIPGTIPASD